MYSWGSQIGWFWQLVKLEQGGPVIKEATPSSLGSKGESDSLQPAYCFSIKYVFFQRIGPQADSFYKLRCPYVCLCVCPSHPGNHASQWIKDLWSKVVSLILTYLQTFLSFRIFNNFFPFFKKIWFLGILGQPYCGATNRTRGYILCFRSA